MANEMAEKDRPYAQWYNTLTPEQQAQEDERYNAWAAGGKQGFYNSGDYGNGTSMDYSRGVSAGAGRPLSKEEYDAIGREENAAEYQRLIDSGMDPDEADRQVYGAPAQGNVSQAIDDAWNGFRDAGKNKYKATPYQTDPNAFNYGGYEGGAQDWSDYATAQQGRSQQYEDQYAMQGADMISAGRGNMYANEDAGLIANEQGSRGYQGDALGLAQAAAYGLAPSVAQEQLGYGLSRVIADQSSAAAGARGAAAMAMAQQNAMGNSASAMSDANFQAAMLRAQEMAQARNAYMSGAQDMRQQDQGRIAQNNQNNQFNAQQGQNEAQLGLGLAQVGLGYGNQAQGYGAQANQVNQAQLQAQGNQQGIQAQSAAQANSINSNIAAANAAARQAQINKAIDTTVGVATTVGRAAAGDPTAVAGAGSGLAAGRTQPKPYDPSDPGY